MLYHLPFGRTEVPIDIPSKYNARLIKPNNAESTRDEIKEIERAIKTPIKSRRLFEIAREGRKAVIIGSVLKNVAFINM